MKKLFIALAAVVMLFTACGKDDMPVAGNNQMVYNGTLYNLTSYYEYNSEMIFYGCEPVTENEEAVPQFYFLGEGYKESLNKTFDLTHGPIEDFSSYWIVMEWSDGSHLSFWNANQAENMSCGYNGEDHENASVFKSGTMTITKDDTAFIYQLKGVLVNDDTIDMKLYVPKEEFNNLNEE